MAKDGTARKPTEPDVFETTEAGARCAVGFRLLQIAVEVQRGSLRLDKREVAGEHAFMFVFFTLGEKSPPTNGVILDGVLYVSALDAGAFRGRERERLLAVARGAVRTNA